MLNTYMYNNLDLTYSAFHLYHSLKADLHEQNYHFSNQSDTYRICTIEIMCDKMSFSPHLCVCVNA